jgi:hypothetical protein
MQKYLVFLAAAMALLLLSACRAQPAENKTGLGEEVSLTEGQATAIKGEPLQLKFVDVAGDSRCPTGVTCIWAGQVKCNVEMTYRDSVELQALVQSGGSSSYTSFNYKEYRIDFDVLPYPEAGKEISQSEYRLKVKVTK